MIIIGLDNFNIIQLSKDFIIFRDMQDVPETFVILNIGDILNIRRLFAIKRASRYTPTHANRRNEEKKLKRKRVTTN